MVKVAKRLNELAGNILDLAKTIWLIYLSYPRLKRHDNILNLNQHFKGSVLVFMMIKMSQLRCNLKVQ